MLLKWSDVTPAEGTAAYQTAQLAANRPIVDGFVLSVSAMEPTLAERHEQIDSLLKVRDPENDERVAAELKRTILTVRVPKPVQNALASALESLGTPVLLRLSNAGPVADPLAPTLVIGVEDAKSSLDAVRMLYAEMYTAPNLDMDSVNRSASIIIQRMPAVNATYRIMRIGTSTIVEGTRGLGCWVGFGEPDRFLFENGAFVRAEHGNDKGLTWENGTDEFERTPLGGEDAQKLLESVKEYLDATQQPLLCCATDNGFLVLGAGPAI